MLYDLNSNRQVLHMQRNLTYPLCVKKYFGPRAQESAATINVGHPVEDKDGNFEDYSLALNTANPHS